MKESQVISFVPDKKYLRGSSSNIESLGMSETLLFDLDDTIAIYEDRFIVNALYNTVKDHIANLTDNYAKLNAIQLYKYMNFGNKQKEILSEHLNKAEISDFWSNFTNKFSDNIKPEHIKFDDKLIKFINFATRNGINVGIISNSSEEAGSKVLNCLNESNGIDLSDKSLFVGSSPNRKPNREALANFVLHTGMNIDPSKTSYIGNSMSDLKFAKKYRNDSRTY